MINIANSGVTNIYLGTSGVTAVYLGNDLVWSIGGKDYTKEYFTIKMLGADTLKWNRTDVYYSLNGGEWTAWDATNGLAVVEGDEVRLKGSAANSTGITTTTASFNVYGNIMSLRYGDNFEGQTVADRNAFKFLLLYSKVYDASNLCLTATDVGESGYQSLFHGCPNLTYGPKIIYPIKTTSTRTYTASCMFQECPSLVSCGDLELIKATASNYAFERMFYYCTSLVKSPKITYRLSGATDTVGTISKFFEGCSSLSEIEFYTPEISSVNPTNFSNGVSATGTFKKSAETTWPIGINGVPTGWTVIDV